MDNDFMQFVYARCEKALEENAGYMRLQSDSAKASKCKDFDSYIEIIDELMASAEELCYMKGFNDAMRIVINPKGADQHNS